MIVYHSVTGGTRHMAVAAASGAKDQAGINVQNRLAPEVEPDDVLAADGYLFAMPEMLGSMSGLMKDFFDRTYYPCLDRLNGRPYAALICAGSDGQGALRQLERIVTGWRLRAVAEPIIVSTRAQTPEAILARKTIGPVDLERCRILGTAFAEGLALGIF